VQVQNIMSSRVVTVELDDSLEAVKEIFDSTRFHHLLVVGQGKKLEGVVSDRDLLRALSPFLGSLSENARDVATLRKHVHQIMTRNPVTLPPEASVESAIDAMLAHPISCVPIVDPKFKPVGIVSWRDVLRNLRQQSAAPPE
jgi:acetoin utilization protein AcuB